MLGLIIIEGSVLRDIFTFIRPNWREKIWFKNILQGSLKIVTSVWILTQILNTLMCLRIFPATPFSLPEFQRFCSWVLNKLWRRAKLIILFHVCDSSATSLSKKPSFNMTVSALLLKLEYCLSLQLPYFFFS